MGGDGGGEGDKKRGRVRVATNMASHEFDTLVAHNVNVHLHLCG